MLNNEDDQEIEQLNFSQREIQGAVAILGVCLIGCCACLLADVRILMALLPLWMIVRELRPTDGEK